MKFNKDNYLHELSVLVANNAITGNAEGLTKNGFFPILILDLLKDIIMR